MTATASGTISTITVTPVSISTLAPPNARSGDLWWDSDEGELNVYYQDANSAQWVIANSGIGTTAGSGGGGGGSGGGANVTVSSNPPTSPTPSNGDLWWDSDVGELYIYYTDGDSNQWVETSGGSETVTISDNAPSSPNDGDLWWESDTGSLKIYYNDGDSQQWVDANAGVLSSLSSFIAWSTNSVGIHTTANVGIGTTNVSAVDSSNTATLAVGIVTAHKLFGDGSNLTGVGGTVVISTSAPSSADVGDLWWDSDDGDLLVYFNDGSGSQWVSTSAGATGAQGVHKVLLEAVVVVDLVPKVLLDLKVLVLVLKDPQVLKVQRDLQVLKEHKVIKVLQVQDPLVLKVHRVLLRLLKEAQVLKEFAGAQGAAGSGGSAGAQGATGPLSSRTTTSAATGSIAQTAYADITISTPGKAFALLKIAISAPAWVILYTDASSRTSDAAGTGSGRSEGTDPTPGSGVLAEVSTTTSGASTFNMTPRIDWLE